MHLNNGTLVPNNMQLWSSLYRLQCVLISPLNFLFCFFLKETLPHTKTKFYHFERLLLMLSDLVLQRSLGKLEFRNNAPRAKGVFFAPPDSARVHS